PASTVFVAEPDIADVQVRSPELIYVFGRRPGDTTIYAVGDRNTVLANLSVHVTHNLSARPPATPRCRSTPPATRSCSRARSPMPRNRRTCAASPHAFRGIPTQWSISCG